MTERLRELLALIERRPVAAIVVLGLLTFLPGLGGGFLWDRDETWYAGCALTMLQTGDWLVPAAGDRIFLEKPPLAYWLVAVSFTALGVTEFAARLPSALLGIATLLVTYWVGARWIGRRTGLVAAGLLGTCVHFGVMNRMVLTDGPLVLGMTAAMACWWRMQRPHTRYLVENGAAPADESPPPARYALWCALGGAAVGVAIMAKGPLGLLPGLMALGFVLARRDFSFFVRARWALIVGIAAIAVVALPWYVAIYQVKGEEFFDEFILKQNLSRFGEPIQGHTGPIYYYLPVILIGFLPWTFLLLAAPFKRRRYDEFDLMLACWALVPIVMFSLMATKLPHYIAMSFPAIALFVAREVVWRLERGAEIPRLMAGGFWAMPVVALVGLAGALALGAIFVDVSPWALGVPSLAALVLFGTGLGYWRLRRDFTSALIYSGVAMTLLFMLTYTVTFRLMAPTAALTNATLRSMEETGADRDPEAARLLFNYRAWQPSVFFYGRGLVTEGGAGGARRFMEALEPGETGIVTVRRHEVEDLLEIVPETHTATVEPLETLVFRNPEWEERFGRRIAGRNRLALVRVTAGPVAE